jgi:polysaccharide pyruvyl transferase WcaK-like protein
LSSASTTIASKEEGVSDKSSVVTAKKRSTISFFGDFGSTNFGNESTLQAILWNLRRLLPEAEFSCICTFPSTAAETYKIMALPISPVVINGWRRKNRLATVIRGVVLGIPSELYRWFEAFGALKETDVLIIAGTGLLTDAYGLLNWGPYSMFKWSLIAKLRGCKLFFVSVGAGPINGYLSRCFVKSALSWADFRSYRDLSSLEYLKGIGFRPTTDRVYPDLAFSLPETVLPNNRKEKSGRPVVGLGLIAYAGLYSNEKPSIETYRNYWQSLATLAAWLLDRGYDIRLLVGQLGDPVLEFRQLLKERLSVYDTSRIIDEPVASVGQLLSQLADTDLVVATRFHNVLFALLTNRPTISISFHHKFSSLMSAMGLSEYCLTINGLKADALIEKVCEIERNAVKLKPLIKERAEKFRGALEEQYELIVKHL